MSSLWRSGECVVHGSIVAAHRPRDRIRHVPLRRRAVAWPPLAADDGGPTVAQAWERIPDALAYAGTRSACPRSADRR